MRRPHENLADGELTSVQAFAEMQSLNDQFRLAVDAIPGLVWSSLPDGYVDFLNQRWLEYTGLPFDQATGWGWQAAVFPTDLPGLLDSWKRVLASGAPGEAEARLRRHDGAHRWFLFRAVPLYDESGKLVKWYGQTTDIEDRKQAEALLAGEKRLLEMIAKGSPAAVTLDALCRLVEELSGGSRVSILLLDAKRGRVRHGAAPSLPDSYMSEIDGRPVSPAFGPCATAARLGDQVVATDIACDTRWPAEYRALARAHGLRACWSTPITSSEGKVLGTLAIYASEPGNPTREQQGRIEQFTHLASIAIERAQTMDAMRQSEERYVLAVEAAGDGHTDWIVASDEFYASPRFLEMSGLPADTTFKGRGDFLSQFPFHPEDRGRVIEAINAHFAAKTVRLEMEMRILRHGEIRWQHLTGLCSRDSSGALVRWNAAVTDITERKRAEAALSLSEERYARAMEAAEEGHWEWNIASDEMFLSARMKEMLGFSPDAQFTNRADFFTRQPVHPDDRQHVNDGCEASPSETTPRYEIEYRIIPRPGELRWVRYRGKVFSDDQGRPVRMSGSFTDITDKKLVNEALRRSEERFSLAIAGSSDGIWDWDILTGEMFYSERAQVLNGLEPGLTVRQRSEWRTMWKLHPDDVESQSRAIDDYVAGRAPAYDGEWRVRQLDGSYRWVHGRGLCVRDERGRATRMIGAISDIHAHKCAEEALRISKERYALAMEAAQDGHWDWIVGTGEYYVSPSDLQLYGLPADTTFTSRADFLARLPLVPEDREAWLRAVGDLFGGTGSRLSMELRANVHGETRWIQFSGVCLRNASGKPIRWSGTSRDVTDRKRAEEALWISEERFALAAAASTDGIWDWDLTTGAMFLSERAQRICGLEPGTTVRPRAEWQSTVELHPDDIKTQGKAVDDYLAGNAPSYDGEYRVRHADGSYRWIRNRGLCVRDAAGQATRLAGAVSDVNARKRIEEDLRSRQEMLELAQKAARAVAFEWRIGAGDGENRWSNDLEAMYGIAPGSYDGTFESWKELVYPEDWPNVRAAIKAAQESGDVVAQYRVVHKSGAIRWLQAKGRMFFDPEGKPSRVVGFMLDVTDRHLAEEELQRMEYRLRQAQRLEAMGTLAGGIAHDFNNLLGAILGYGEMAMRDAPAGSRLRRDLDSIMIAGERGRALVDRILAFSRSGVGERVAVHVEDVVRETLGLFAAKLPNGIALEERLRAGRAAVLGDATQIHQVLMNLVTNAVQAMPSGGTLQVSLDRAKVDLPRVATTGTVTAREYLVLRVADTGSGIPPETLERIFDPFFTTKEVGVGSGLGLSLVHGIVTGLGGAIDVATTVGKGSLFTVYLPRAGDVTDVAEPKRRAPPSTRRGERQRVLVVDDEESLVRLATQTLTELGYTPVGFTTSATAIEAFLADPQRFDAVITDESMPGTSGSELIRKLRAIRPRIPIVLVSGYLNAALVQRAREAGADEVLKKPLAARELATSLARVLHGRAKRAQNTTLSLGKPAAKAMPPTRASASRAPPARRRKTAAPRP